MKYEEVIRETEARGVTLPSEMLEAAKTMGIRRLILTRYLDLQAAGGLLGFAMKSCGMLRNRMLADPSFLFKVGAEIVIDSCCATFAEVQKRGKDFWAEFELYAADLLVGIVVTVALVGLLTLCTYWQPPVAKGFWKLQNANQSFPSSVFEAERPGCRYSVQKRIATYFYKGFLYGSVGFASGLFGQGIANLIMNAKRSVKKSAEDIPIPPLMKTAALWGVFLEFLPILGIRLSMAWNAWLKHHWWQQVPPVAMAFTVGVALRTTFMEECSL
ncbi:Protein RETICULATA-related [Dillenia turbinata]|uniref:Protein RETICULATA-related n=1 Tax=Dillenia turbinata TaxID=194707 RepID=A0AAN8VZC9_9MAGN